MRLFIKDSERRPDPAPLKTDDRKVVLVGLVQQIVLERYGLGLEENSRWSTMSTVKSLTSTLVGAALKQGAIGEDDNARLELLCLQAQA